MLMPRFPAKGPDTLGKETIVSLSFEVGTFEVVFLSLMIELLLYFCNNKAFY